MKIYNYKFKDFLVFFADVIIDKDHRWRHHISRLKSDVTLIFNL